MNNTESVKTKSIRAAKATVILKPLSQVASLLVTILIVRALSKTEYGIYNIFYSIISLLGMVASFGIANTLQRYIPEYYSKGEFRIAHQLYRVASLIRLFTNIIILGIILLLWDLISPFLKIEEYKYQFIVFALIIILHMQRSNLESCLNSYFLQKASQIIAVIFIIIKCFGYGVAILKNWDLWAILLVDLLGYVLIFISLEVVYLNKIPKNEGVLQKISENERKRLLRYSLFYNFNDAGVGILEANFDNFIIIMFLDPVAVGAYAFCHQITKKINHFIPVQYLLNVIRPMLFSIDSTSDDTKAIQYFQILIKINYIFLIPIFFFIALFGDELVMVAFNSKFIEYSSVLTVVFLFSLLNAFQMPTTLLAQLKERADIMLYSKIFAVYNIVADIIFIKYFGLWGAVFATGTAHLGKNLFIWTYVRKYASFKGMQSFFSVRFVIWGLVAALALALKSLLKDPLILLILSATIFTIVFIFQLQFYAFTEKEKRYILKNFKSRRAASLIRFLGLAT